MCIKGIESLGMRLSFAHCVLLYSELVAPFSVNACTGLASSLILLSASCEPYAYT